MLVMKMTSLLENQTNTRRSTPTENPNRENNATNNNGNDKEKIKNVVYVSNGEVKNITLYYCPKENKIIERLKD